MKQASSTLFTGMAEEPLQAAGAASIFPLSRKAWVGWILTARGPDTSANFADFSKTLPG